VILGRDLGLIVAPWLQVQGHRAGSAMCLEPLASVTSSPCKEQIELLCAEWRQSDRSERQADPARVALADARHAHCSIENRRIVEVWTPCGDGCRSPTCGELRVVADGSRSPDVVRSAPRSSMVSTPPTSGRIPDPSTGAAVQVGLSDNGRQVELRRGQRLRVELAGTWAAPVAGPTGEGAGLQVLHRDSAHGSSAQGPAVATFTAVRVGLASVLATEDVPCLHTQPRCARPQGHFELTVLVIPPPGMSAGPLPVPAP
jgi:hypothetical protein